VLEDQIPGEFQSARGRDRAPERPVELAVVLGAFVAHLWSPPAGASASQPYAAAVRVAATQG
jgi:hypothetical protein